MGRYKVIIQTRMRSYSGLVGIVNPDDQAQVLQAAASLLGSRGVQPGDRITVRPERGGRPVVPEVVV